MEVYKMNPIKCGDTTRQIESIDSLIIFFSDEDRSIKLLDELISRSTAPQTVFVVAFPDTKLSALEAKAKDNNLNIISAKIGVVLSDEITDCFTKINAYLDGKKSIGLDISSMPIPIFAQIFHYIFVNYSNLKKVAYYTEPESYDLFGKTPNADSLNVFDFSAYTGEIDMKAIIGFEGKTSQSGELKRVVFYIMGFEIDYLKPKIDQDVNPDITVPINGFPSYFPKYKDISLINNNTNYFENDIEIVFAEANNPFGTYNQLFVLSKKYKNYCIDILPSGPKPMALGACLYALKNSDAGIRIIFPFPTNYNKKQSNGSDIIWEYCL